MSCAREDMETHIVYELLTNKNETVLYATVFHFHPEFFSFPFALLPTIFIHSPKQFIEVLRNLIVTEKGARRENCPHDSILCCFLGDLRLRRMQNFSDP